MSDTRYEYQSDFARKYFAFGLEAGRGALVRSLLRILDHRGLVLSADDRKRIESCPDLATLERWMDRAMDIVRLRLAENPAPGPEVAEWMRRTGK